MITAGHHTMLGGSALPRFLRMTITHQRSDTIGHIQISDIRLLDAVGLFFTFPPETTVTSYIQGVDTSSNLIANENPAMVIDNNVNTKYCSGGVSGRFGLDKAIPCDIVIDLGVGNSIDLSVYSRWQWYTANDEINRDPSSFAFYSSINGKDWTMLDSAAITPTTIRNALAYTGALPSYKQVGGGRCIIFFRSRLRCSRSAHHSERRAA